MTIVSHETFLIIRLLDILCAQIELIQKTRNISFTTRGATTHLQIMFLMKQFHFPLFVHTSVTQHKCFSWNTLFPQTGWLNKTSHSSQLKKEKSVLVNSKSFGQQTNQIVSHETLVFIRAIIGTIKCFSWNIELVSSDRLVKQKVSHETFSTRKNL